MTSVTFKYSIWPKCFNFSRKSGICMVICPFKLVPVTAQAHCLSFATNLWHGVFPLHMLSDLNKQGTCVKTWGMTWCTIRSSKFFKVSWKPSPIHRKLLLLLISTFNWIMHLSIYMFFFADLHIQNLLVFLPFFSSKMLLMTLKHHLLITRQTGLGLLENSVQSLKGHDYICTQIHS